LLRAVILVIPRKSLNIPQFWEFSTVASLGNNIFFLLTTRQPEEFFCSIASLRTWLLWGGVYCCDWE